MQPCLKLRAATHSFFLCIVVLHKAVLTATCYTIRFIISLIDAVRKLLCFDVNSFDINNGLLINRHS